MKATLVKRGADSHGSGDYLASRGSRKHMGIDFACSPGCQVYPDISGLVTKLGIPYADPKKREYRYVQITDDKGVDVRYFYLHPDVEIGQAVTTDTVIGICQDLTKIYEGITNHVHFEVKKNGKHINPEKYLIISD